MASSGFGSEGYKQQNAGAKMGGSLCLVENKLCRVLTLTVISSTPEMEQEDFKSETSLNYIEIPCL